MSYVKSLKEMRKQLEREVSQEAPPQVKEKPTGFASRVMPSPIAKPTELKYDPNEFIMGAMRKLRESRVSFSKRKDEELARMKDKPKENTFVEALAEEPIEPATDENGSRPGMDSREGGGATSDLHGLIDRTESGGGYDTLFGHANKDVFSDVKITQKTIGELKAFANGPYGEHVKAKLGYKATPMGRYQFVGSTLAAVANEMGLPDDTVFTPAVQDDMFAYWAKKTIAGKDGAEARKALRGQWEGFKSVSNEELDVAIERFRNV